MASLPLTAVQTFDLILCKNLTNSKTQRSTRTYPHFSQSLIAKLSESSKLEMFSALTLSHSSEGSPALAVFRHHKLKIVVSELYLDFLTTSFLFLVVVT
jgi:hypothetical protein